MDNPYVLLETSLGDVLIELFPAQAPLTVRNFLQYVDDEHYDGTLFHRVVRGFVIQGGGYDSNLEKKPTRPPIPNEADNSLSNTLNTVAMARAPQKDSATDEFFVNCVDNSADLDHHDETDEGFGYAVFGQVVDGADVVKKLNWKVVKGNERFPDLPAEALRIHTARRFE